MSHYQHRLVIAAPPAIVYAALTTAAGLRGWWTQDCDISQQVGEEHHFRFGPHYKTMRIERLETEREVRWHGTAAHIAMPQLSRKDEWVGTDIVFRLQALASGQTRLDFEHIGLLPALECYEMCRQGWQHYLGSLQQYAETGRGTPYEAASTASA